MKTGALKTKEKSPFVKKLLKLSLQLTSKITLVTELTKKTDSSPLEWPPINNTEPELKSSNVIMIIVN